MDQMGKTMGKVLLFYTYTYFEHPKHICKWQYNICRKLNLKGRIIVAHEGINGTVGGSDEEIEQYKQMLLEHPQLHDIDIKESDGDAHCFPRLYVAVKDEIVYLGLKDQARIANTGVYLTPSQTHALLNNKPKDLVILDARNGVESAIGAFNDAIKPNIKYFRELPEYVDNHLDEFKNKQVLMYCTGGIRCERATAYLKEKGVAKEVYQIEGGIHRYAQQYPDGYFRGKNYVFDRRIAVKINDDVLSNCSQCDISSDEYNNCLNALCNKHYIACVACLKQYSRCCSILCQELVATQKVRIRTPYTKVSVKAS